MKQLSTLTIIAFLFLFKLNAQTTVLSELIYPEGATFNGDYLYFSSMNADNVREILKIDITEANPTKTVVLTNLSNEYSGDIKEMVSDGSYIYFTNSLSDQDYNSWTDIVKFSLTDANPTPTTILTTTEEVDGLAILGNKLYIGEHSLNPYIGYIAEIDITQTTPTKTVLLQTNNVRYGSMEFNGNTLYINTSHDLDDYSNRSSRISKIEITETNPSLTTVAELTGISGVFDIILNDDANKLYFSTRGNTGTKGFKKIDLTQTNPTPTDVTPFSGEAPSRMAKKHEDSLYYVIQPDQGPPSQPINYGSINKMTINGLTNAATASVKNISRNKNIEIYPNPTNDFLKISGFNTTANYTIYDLLGKRIIKGTYTKNESINVSNLQSGIYYLKLDNLKTLKFAKK